MAGKVKLTKAQVEALRRVELFASRGVLMPFADEARSFEACERKGVLEYRSVSDGHPRNGYCITPAGRAALSQQTGSDNE